MATFATFQRLKDKGVAALKAGEYAAAKPYLVQAAECMVELAEENKDLTQRAEQEQYAKELMELARDCDRKLRRGGGAGGGGKRGDRMRTEDEDGAKAEDWVVREKPDVRFDDIAGLDEVKEEIHLKMIYPFRHRELAAQYGIDVGGGMLMFGPPGTGKTMFAKAIATELDATMFVISPAQIMSKWVGEAEQNVRKLFDAAKAEAKAVIFMDEVEALVPKRRSSDSTVMQRVVPQILQELEGFDRKADRALMFLGATNEPWALDSAMMRPGRLDTKVYIPLPDAPARLRLFEIYLGKRPIDDDVNFAELAELSAGYSGADIKAIAARAASRPFLESVAGAAARKIMRADVLAVLQETPPSVSPKDVAKFDEWARNTA
ncbi:MAG: ATP-binding protein [Phycisphaerae bacterium]|nr:ATP-binding protein [Phycisphaerae bacterium]MCZ2398415.1 ATP-binding protein [Phycisphaerae bacterium]NUQ49378.1 ATP-binding protein [Phycisphaerae bacterium]